MTLPETVSALGGEAFRQCGNLESINIPLSFTSSGGGLFNGCDKLTSLTVPEGITKLPNSAFSGMNQLTEIELPQSLRIIGDYAFSGCRRLPEIELPEGLTQICYRAFEDCDTLTQIDIPDGVTSLGGEAMRNCDRLRKVKLPKSWKSSGGGLFAGCPELRKLTVPEGISVLPNSALSSSDGLRMVFLPESLTKIGDYAFSSCAKLRYVILPEKTVNVNYRAFEYCSLLESVVIRGMNVSFGGEVFRSHGDLTLYGWANSNVALYAIQNGIPFVPLGEGDADYGAYAADMNNTSFTTTATAAEAGTAIPMTLRYAIKSAAFADMSDIKLTIAFSNTLDLDESSIRLNGAPVSDYTYSTRLLTVPVTSASGTLTLSATPNEAGAIAVFAQMSYATSSVQKVETLGSLHLEAMEALQGGYSLRFLGGDTSSATVYIVNGSTQGGNALVAVAAYDGDGNLIAVNLEYLALTPGGAATQTVEYPSGSDIDRIGAYVLDPVTLAPQCGKLSVSVY